MIAVAEQEPVVEAGSLAVAEQEQVVGAAPVVAVEQAALAAARVDFVARFQPAVARTELLVAGCGCIVRRACYIHRLLYFASTHHPYTRYTCHSPSCLSSYRSYPKRAWGQFHKLYARRGALFFVSDKRKRQLSCIL